MRARSGPRPRRRRERADVARGDPVDGIGVVRYPDAVSRPARDEIVPPPNRRPTGLRRSSRDPLGELLGPADAPAPRAARRRRRRARRRPRRGSRRGRPAARPPPPASPIPRASASSVQTPRAGRPRLAPSPRAVAIPTRRPVKEPGPSPTAIRSTAPQPPAAVGRSARPRSSSPVACSGPPLRGEPQQRLVQDLAVAPGAGGGVDGRGVEADDDQGVRLPGDPERRRSRLSCL